MGNDAKRLLRCQLNTSSACRLDSLLLCLQQGVSGSIRPKSSSKLRNSSRVVICRGRREGRHSRHASFATFLARTHVPLPSGGRSRRGHRTGAPHSPSALGFQRARGSPGLAALGFSGEPPGAPPPLSSGQRPSCVHGPRVDTASGAKTTHCPAQRKPL